MSLHEESGSRFKATRITDSIFQNGYITEREAAVLLDLGVTHILNLDLPYGATRVEMPAGLKVTEILLHDMAPMSQEDVRRVVAVIQRAVDLEGGRIYVHCNAGLSRSPTAVWLYLVATGWDPHQASETISAAATHLDAPDPILVHELELDSLKDWLRRPRWELWRRGEKTHPCLLSIHLTEAEVEKEKTMLEDKQRGFEARGFPVRVRYWVEELRPS